MKIVCVGRNYTEHISELGNERPSEPVLFMKPDSAILRNTHPFYIPDFSDNVHYEAELVVRIHRIGKNISERFANRYYKEITLGLDFTARDLQDKLKAKGLPWERAKAFDCSAVIGDFVPVTEISNLSNVPFRLEKNGAVVQASTPQHMLYSIDALIAEISKYFTLKIGDLIFTGTPAGVGKVEKDDILEGYLDQKKVLSTPIK